MNHPQNCPCEFCEEERRDFVLWWRQVQEAREREESQRGTDPQEIELEKADRWYDERPG